MGYFLINGLGFDCGYGKTNCPKKISCQDCLMEHLKKSGFIINSNTRIKSVSETRQHELIWQKFNG